MLSSRLHSAQHDGESAVEAALAPAVQWAEPRPTRVAGHWPDNNRGWRPRRATRLAQRGTDLVLDASHRLTRSVRLAGDSGARFIRDRPYGAVLLAAATGAALVTLAWQLAARRSRRY